MFRSFQLAVATALTTVIASAQNPFESARQGSFRPALSIKFEIDGSEVTLRIDADDVVVDGDATVSRVAPGFPGLTSPNVRLLDAAGTPFASLSIDASGVNLRFAPRSERAWLGVDLQPIPDVLAEHLGLDVGRVSLVAHVRPDSPAAKCGLAENDIVIRVEGHDAADPDAVCAAIASAKPGDELALTVLRRGAEKALTAKLRADVPFLSELPVLGELFRTREAESTAESQLQRRYIYDTALRNYLSQVSGQASVQREYAALFDAGGNTYVVPKPVDELLDTGTSPTEDTATRLDRLEAQLARIEDLLKKLDERRDN